MATALADSPTATSGQEPPAPGSTDAPPPVSGPGAPKQTCSQCGASMDAEQEWCLQCGAGVPGSLATRSSTWRSTATVLTATAILAIGAATAAYAALTKTKTPARHVTVVAQVPAPVTATPATPAAPAQTTPPTAPATATAKASLPKSIVKPPKIPLTAATPKVPAATTPATTPKASTPAPAPSTATAPQPTALTLDTNAVTTYNPDGYPAGNFGDPSLAIDGDTSTGWTALVDPTIAPKMAAGLLVDLKGEQKLSSIELITSTPGMTVQVFGANGAAAPAAVTDPSWTKLTPSQIEKTRHALIKLTNTTTPFRFVLLWISGVPAASVGTPQAPGRVSVNELELFPAK